MRALHSALPPFRKRREAEFFGNPIIEKSPINLKNIFRTNEIAV